MIANRSFNEEVQWVSPPSETILRLLHNKRVSFYSFREQLQLSQADFFDLIHDKLEINSNIAKRLSKTLGSSETFWINRYQEFTEYVTFSNNEIQKENRPFLNSLSKIRHTEINSLADNFKVSTLEHLIMDYFEMPQVLYSRSQTVEPSPASLANWMRECELTAESVLLNKRIPFFGLENLERTIPEIVSHSKVNNVLKVIPKIKEALNSVGVILVLSPSDKGLGVSGFTKRLFKKYRLVVVTDRFKNNAAFWFTLLHELAHCLLHQLDQTLIHYSDDEFILANSSSNKLHEEEEANEYVESLLFPPELRSQLGFASRSYKSLIKLAVKYEIPASLVAAQIHRTQLAPYSYFRKVYQPVEFQSIS
ncbi:MAG: ImmA/IrrE family metallo-endopeptidase [Bacteroidia bacterium]|nr:ImmA/IrrE family metallo-endopeptidase [Bacteroidia bacterium]